MLRFGAGVVLVVLGLIAAGVAFVWWHEWPWVAPPTYTCSIPDKAACGYAEAGAGDFWDIPDRPSAIEFVPAPEEWATSPYPGVNEAEFAARVELFFAPPILAACYTYSESHILCFWPLEPITP